MHADEGRDRVEAVFYTANARARSVTPRSRDASYIVVSFHIDCAALTLRNLYQYDWLKDVNEDDPSAPIYLERETQYGQVERFLSFRYQAKVSYFSYQTLVC